MRMRGNVLSWIRLGQRNRAGGREWQMSSSSWNMKSAARSRKVIPVVVVMTPAAAADTGRWLILVLFCIPPVPAGRHEPKATPCQVFALLRVLRRGVCVCSRALWFGSCASAAFPRGRFTYWCGSASASPSCRTAWWRTGACTSCGREQARVGLAVGWSSLCCRRCCGRHSIGVGLLLAISTVLDCLTMTHLDLGYLEYTAV